MEKNIGRNLADTLKLSTFINTLTHIEYLCRSVSDHFSCMRAMPIVIGFIVIALNPKFEVPLTFNHCVIGLLIAVKRLHIVNVVFNFTTTATEAKV